MSEVPSDPIERFSTVFERAKAADPAGYDAVCLATCDGAGRPSARMVLLKSFSRDGFTIYMNLESRKAREALGTGFAALCFYWPGPYEQVRVEGAVHQVPDVEADGYFASRPRGSQIGAWASRQSEVLDRRETLLQRFEEVAHRYEGREVPRPPHWSGLRLVPDRIEFWVGQPNRLHIRTRHIREGDGWRTETLYP